MGSALTILLEGHRSVAMVQLPAEGGETYTPEVILVTGGAGFIASHLVIRLVNNFPHYKVRCCRLARRVVTPGSCLRWSMCVI